MLASRAASRQQEKRRRLKKSVGECDAQEMSQNYCIVSVRKRIESMRRPSDEASKYMNRKISRGMKGHDEYSHLSLYSAQRRQVAGLRRGLAWTLAYRRVRWRLISSFAYQAAGSCGKRAAIPKATGLNLQTALVSVGVGLGLGYSLVRGCVKRSTFLQRLFSLTFSPDSEGRWSDSGLMQDETEKNRKARRRSTR